MKSASKILSVLLALGVASCAQVYRDEVLPPTDQELEASKSISPSGALQTGVFHMQRVQTGSTVRVRDRIQLKRPDLPPFDVAYISRNLEAILLELANAAGESIVIPESLRNRTITLVHSGANFREMLDLVLRKAGYHYNYVDGVWYITRYPIRNYVLEASQGERSGSLIASEELSREDADSSSSSSSSSSGGSNLETDYTDEVWSQVESTLAQLVDVGETSGSRSSSSSSGMTASGQLMPSMAEEATAALSLLAPPSAEEGEQPELFGTITEGGGLQPSTVTPPDSTDHLSDEEDAQPWYRVTRSAGLITVRAAPEAHRLIEEYLEQVQGSLQRQVMVEARIVAIIRDRTTDRGASLSKNIDLGDTVLGTLGFTASTPVTDAEKAGGFLNLSSTKSDMTGIIQSLSDVADVYTISSPSLLARNNQISRVSLTRQLGYAETEVEQNTTSTGDVTIGTRTDTAAFKNAGTVMSVMPFIGRSRVQLRLRLSVASKSGDTAIQTTVGDSDTITNFVPELSNNVVDQDMVLEFGRVYAIGGLVETSTGVTNSYAPALSLVPGLSEIFQRAANRKQDTEFVVLVKVSRS